MFTTAAQSSQKCFFLAGDCGVEEAIPRKVPLHAVAVLDGGAINDDFDVWRDSEMTVNELNAN